MSLWRQNFLIQHGVTGDLFMLEQSGKIIPRPGSNVWLLRVPS